nr:EOG090X07YB [Polyphemus pediculus]
MTSSTCSNKEIDSMVLMQIFSPLLTSHRIMNQEFQNSYDGITCEDGSTVAFFEEINFLLIAVAQQSVNAVHLVRVCHEIMQHVCGPSFSLLKHSDSHSEMTTVLIEKFLELRKSSQPIITESLHYENIREDINSYFLRMLQGSTEELKVRTGIPPSKVHVLILKGTSVIAFYSGKGTSELKTKEILFLIIVASAFTRQSSSSTHNSLIILEACVPYTIHLQTFENGITILLLIEAGLGQISKSMYSLLKNVTTYKNTATLKKQIVEVQGLAKKLKHRDTNISKWGETLVWRDNLRVNQSAMSALARQIQHGFELICLDPALLFTAVGHVSAVIELIKMRMPVLGLSSQLPCRLSPLLHFYPGLVHFVLIDRRHHRMISPNLPTEKEPTFCNNMWQMFHTSLQWLHEGIYQLMWNDKQFCYSHSIWIGDATNQKLPWKFCWDIQTGTLGYPAIMGSEYYENLMKSGVEDEEAEPVHYFQLFCIHLGLTSPATVLQQSKEIAKDLKAFIFPTSSELEDLC